MKWTPELIEQLIMLYPHQKTEDVATVFGCSVQTIYNKVYALRLKKSAAFLASPASGRTTGKQGIGTRFVKGIIPWNKGTKGLMIGGVETQFKPGTRQGRALEIYKPIGSERISKDGYLQRKLNDDLPFQKRWCAVHQIVWEEVNDTLPRNHIVVFRDGNKQNITLDNLELISRADLMRRNSYHRYGKEIAQLVQLRGAVTRQINKRKGS